MSAAGFAPVLRAEWTKFRTLRLTAWALLSTVVLAVVLSSAGAETDVVYGAPVGTCRFVYQPLDGDGSITARVVAQPAGATLGADGPQAKAGVMIRQSTDLTARYAALMVTPDLGVRLQANLATDIPGGDVTAPRWLRLARAGNTVTGFESPDGVRWTVVGKVDLGPLPGTVQAGLFSASPGQSGDGAPGSTLDRVALDPAPGGRWTHTDVGQPTVPGRSTEAGGGFEIAGQGDLWYPAVRGVDRVQQVLVGILAGLVVIVVLGVLSIAPEYSRNMIRTTLAAAPARGRVLAAKAAVLGAASFGAGLVASLAMYALALYRDRATFVAAKGFPPLPPLTDPAVLRAVAGTAMFLAVLAVLSLAVGTILRHAVASITLLVGLVLVPFLVAQSGSAKLLLRATPAAGLAIQRTGDGAACGSWERLARGCDPAATGPWAGFAVLCAYAVVAAGVAYWLLRRRDA